MSAKKNTAADQKNSFDAVCLRIDALLTAKKWNEALNLLKRGHEETSAAFSSERGELFRELRLAYLFFSLGDLRKARQYLEQILEENENEPEALLMMGYFCLLQEDKEDAIYFYTRLLAQKHFQAKAQKVLVAIKNSPNMLNLTMKKKVAFFIKIPSVSLAQRMSMGADFFADFLAPFFLRWNVKIKKLLYRLSIIALIFLLVLLAFWGVIDQKSGESFFGWFSHQWKKTFGTPTSVMHDDEKSLWRAMEVDRLAPQKKSKPSQTLLDASLKDIYRMMEKNIFEKNINAAIVNYNKALLLEPPTPILQKFKVLAGFIPKPQWHHFLGDEKDRSILYRYPKLYRDTYWKLSGKISNVLVRGDVVRFRLLIFEGKSLKEMVSVEFQKPQIVPENGQKYQMLVRFVGYDQKKNLAMKGVMMQRSELK